MPIKASSWKGRCPRRGRRGSEKWRQRRPIIRGEARGFEEISRLNLWRLISCAVRRQQVGVGPADRRQQEGVGPADRRQQEGAGLACRERVEPGTARGGNADQKYYERLRKTEESGKSNLCFPDSCAVRRQQVAVGPADRRYSTVAS